MIKYQINEIETANGIEKVLIKNDEGIISFIPTDPTNSDYQAYLATLASSNPSTPQAGE